MIFNNDILLRSALVSLSLAELSGVGVTGIGQQMHEVNIGVVWTGYGKDSGIGTNTESGKGGKITCSLDVSGFIAFTAFFRWYLCMASIGFFDCILNLKI